MISIDHNVSSAGSTHDFAVSLLLAERGAPVLAKMAPRWSPVRLDLIDGGEDDPEPDLPG